MLDARALARRVRGRGATLGLPFLALIIAGPALADPCEAIPDRGPIPQEYRRGSFFAGEVVYVGDGDSLCVAVGAARSSWVEVRLADFDAPELGEPGGRLARSRLSDLAMGRRLECVAGRRSYDRVVATCALGGVSLAAQMRARGFEEGGRGRRPRSLAAS